MGNKDILNKLSSLKSILDGYRPFSEHVVKQLRDYYRIGLTYTSNAIEGNTLTESETKVIIEDGITIGGKSMREHYEAIGHAKAYDHIYSLLGKPISEEDVLSLHKLFFQQIDPENAGRYRQKNVIITGTDYLPPDYQKVPELMKKHIVTLSRKITNKHILEQASDLHAEFESIHPFTDGNGRIGRLLLSILSMKNGYCPIIVPPIRRAEYITAMQKSNKGDLNTLRAFILSVIYEEMKSLTRLVESLAR
ncbi:MAG: Fic family protein [Thermodesulfovibrionales bacterium]|nr:Fic family protein [Nitrospinota bacterium]MCG2709438.1 Fic family protein [Thermodesulfovibrionales bacterium]